MPGGDLISYKTGLLLRPDMSGLIAMTARPFCLIYVYIKE
ncbi:hypothetical protein ASZ90_007639 [hydrocarbon metagenome]|uniref:Uncharacterized protein n=1 Tax=hydrocarbon metagenome TaxID=938273 RepID=A0A0W8FPA5_9ZZZZ